MPRRAILAVLAVIVAAAVLYELRGWWDTASDLRDTTEQFERVDRRIESMMPIDRELAAEANEFDAAAASYRQQLQDELRRHETEGAAADAEIASLAERLRAAAAELAEVEAERRRQESASSEVSAEVARLRAAYEELMAGGGRAGATAEGLLESLRKAGARSEGLSKPAPLTMRLYLTHHAATKEAGAYTLVRLDEDKVAFRLGSVPSGARDSAKARRQTTETALAAIAKAVARKIKAHGAPAREARGEIVATKPTRGSAVHGHILALLDLLLRAGLRDVVFESQGK